ncbi:MULTISPECIES: aldehyde dehydrogenase family protein [Streptomyces]|uniref:Aldehyde dehydrogenase family protein n=1 Tax=Streptomyces fimbriatus TaxID=68197 RepID=A0ABW0D4F5_STRFI
MRPSDCRPAQCRTAGPPRTPPAGDAGQTRPFAPDPVTALSLGGDRVREYLGRVRPAPEQTRPVEEGTPIRPVVLTGVAEELKAHYDETFGPATVVHVVDSSDEAV